MVIELYTVNLFRYIQQYGGSNNENTNLSSIFCENADTGNFILIRAQTRYKSIEILFPVRWWW